MANKVGVATMPIAAALIEPKSVPAENMTSSGFTLIELLVVLGVMSLLGVIALQALPRRPAALSREKMLAAISLQLNDAHASAMRSGSPVEIKIASFEVDDLTLQPVLGDSGDDIIVYPDGSSTGGILRRGGKPFATIDWLTAGVVRAR